MTNPNSTEGEEATRKIRSLAEFCAEGERLGLTAFDIVDALRKRPEFADCLPGAPGETGDTSGVPASAAPSISDEQILHLWDAYVGYETARRSAQKMPLSKDDKLQFARAVLEAASGVKACRSPGKECEWPSLCEGRLCQYVPPPYGVSASHEPQLPHAHGPAICEDCGHRWMAVWPLGA